MKRFSPFLMALLAAQFVACGDENHNEVDDDDTPALNAPLTSLQVLMKGAPKNGDLPDEPKADQVFPSAFDLMDSQSPVKDQAYRGVCSIFSTIALMEHLYKKEGTLKDPDFSEQYLQWSVKNQVKSFQDSEGSSEEDNLEAIFKWGVPEESAWPYEESPWSHRQHPECSGDCNDNEPLACYTNGEPPESAQNAKLFKLKASRRYINSKPKNIKSYMYGTGHAVIAGGQFFYQSWNHGGSNLKVSKEYSRQGYVLYPNADDIAYSNENEAGHSFLLVGWDDNLEVPIVDKAGKQVLDENGNPKVEKGFWLFKNSWGTDSFGIKNPKGAGYGWISYKYVEEFASVAVADEPEIERPAEICDDGIDNDGDGYKDCADSDCAKDAACKSKNIRVESNEAVEIPDDDSNGVISSLEVEGEGTIGKLKLFVDITHPYRRDLTIWLYAPDQESAVVFYGRTDAAQRTANLQKTFTIPDFKGKPFAGEWSLMVIDDAEEDSGRLNSWSLDITPAKK